MYQFILSDFKGREFVLNTEPELILCNENFAKKFTHENPVKFAIEIKEKTGKQFYPSLIKKLC